MEVGMNLMTITKKEREQLTRAVQGTGYDIDGLLTYASVGMASVATELLMRASQRGDVHGQANAMELAKHSALIGLLGLPQEGEVVQA